jgi:pimeloyl-ACP methyl ester carboxylesterase
LDVAIIFSSEQRMKLEPFTIAIGDDLIEDLGRRLQAIRWPESIEGIGWDEGTDRGCLQRLAEYWRSRFDWRVHEARLNALPQFVAELDGLRIHFVHQRGRGPSPFPLVITHGWPGSFVEMEKIIPLLADPAARGADPADAFDVVAPSLPGYGFSQQPPRPGFNPYLISDLWVRLMTGLGYRQFGAQGGDWGASVSTWLAFRFPEHVAGLHLNFIPGSYRPPLGAGEPPLSADEKLFVDRATAWLDAEGAYSHLHGTKPLTQAYGLTDSPIGLAAWIVEKFRAWSDCSGDMESVFSLDELLTNISLYWFTGTIGSSMRLYRENRLRPLRFAAGQRISPPLGVVAFPQEILMPPREWVERVYNVARWTPMPRGGHFAAMEAPELLAAEIREFFRPLREGRAAARQQL